jgi:AGZA family xanthine/uracil permease-like MFS transporter
MNRYRWATSGDVNAFFGLMLDNVAVMVLLVATIARGGAEERAQQGQVFFTREFVMTRMIPGTALGVLLGDLVYTLMAFRLARRTGQQVTAMPLGLDTPSTFGVALLILLPTLQQGYRDFGDHARAMEFSWHVGLVVLAMSGIFKIFCAPFGNVVRRLIPRAGLLGSLAAIALVLIAFLPLVLDGIAGVPLVGMLALAVILWSLVAHRPLPGGVPGAFAAVVLGVTLYWLGHLLGRETGLALVPAPSASGSWTWEPGGMFSFYSEPRGWWGKVFTTALSKLPIALPFALATIVGGIDCTESAAAAGDDYDTGSILMTEGVASLVAGLLGGVIQTTPYIGHPAYKMMGGRAAYTLATALFIGLAGYLGVFTWLFTWLPQAALFPILVFVGLEITAQSFQATPTRHYPALALAIMPALAYLCLAVINKAFARTPPQDPAFVQTLRCLANGFIITSLVWASTLACLIDGHPHRAALYFLGAALLTLFGIMHSPLPAEQIDLPHRVLALVPESFQDAVQAQTPYHWAGAYGLIAVFFLGLGWWKVPAPPPS